MVSKERYPCYKTMPADIPPLGGTGRDVTVALFKGGLGAIPFVGSILAEIVGQLIPEQRSTRLEQYAMALHRRLSTIEEFELRRKLREPDSIDLFEDGAMQSARAIRTDRIEYLAKLVADGIVGDDAQRLQSKRLLNLLRELDDAQIIVLASHLQKNQRDSEFWKRHPGTVDFPFVSIDATRAEEDKALIQQLATDQLIRLGLLKPHFATVRQGEIPELDIRTGMLKAAPYAELKSLGLLVLRQLGLAGEEDF